MLSTSSASALTSASPIEPDTLEQAGLSADLVQQLVLKTLYFCGDLSGTELSERLGLRFAVCEPCLEFLKNQHWCQISGGAGFGGPSYQYRITDAGRSRAMLSLQQNHYVGRAPVPIEQYQRYMRDFQRGVPVRASRDAVRDSLSHMVVSDSIVDAVGPAVNAGHSMFVYGAAGNGKTMIAQAIRKLFTGEMAIPHALEVEGQIIKVFDPVNHDELPLDQDHERAGAESRSDRRWARCQRPLVMVGGELTMDALDLRYSPASGFYRASLQMMANGGLLVIDDFGRQRCSPRELLNRWIVPLESRVDLMTLQSGQMFEIPFTALLVFATNIKPSELADEAFLRRIQYKIFAESPEVEDYIRIFANYCKTMAIAFERPVVEQMLEEYYRPNQLQLRACQPRDLINQALALASYRGEPAHLTTALMDAACRSYFVQDLEMPATYADRS